MLKDPLEYTMIQAIMVGDGYGCPFEFAPMEYIKANNNGKQYYSRQTEKGERGNGTYTDDTQMTLAVLETILSNPKDFRPHMFAGSFVNAYKREVPYRTGYGSRVRVALTNSFSSFEFLSNIADPHQSSNGAIMRCLPCGILSDPTLVQNAAIAQAVASHIHYEAVDSARFLSLLVHALIYDTPPGDKSIRFFHIYVIWAASECGFDILTHPMFTYKIDEKVGVPCDSYATVSAVLDVLYKSNSYTDILRNSVAFGGDVDSVAALAMGIGSLCGHISKFIDPALIETIENGPFGIDYAKELDKKINKYIDIVKTNKNNQPIL